MPEPLKLTDAPWQTRMVLLDTTGLLLAKLALMIWQGTKQLMLDCHPAAVVIASEVNTKVKQPETFEGVALTIPGLDVPE